MGQGPYAAGRDGANVDAAAAVGRALGVFASVMMPAVSDMRASSVEVPGVLGEAGVGEPRANFKGYRMCLAQSRCWASCVRVVVTLCMTRPQALDTASVECVTVTPTARAEHVSAVRTWTAVSVPKESSAAGMGTAGATVASARMATMGLCVTSASAASHHVSGTGEASGLYLGSWGTVNCLCVLLEGVGGGLVVIAAQMGTHWHSLDRDCAECGAFGTGPLAANCSMACAGVNVTVALAPNLDDGWCKERTLDNQLFFFLVENVAAGVILRVRPQESK